MIKLFFSVLLLCFSLFSGISNAQDSLDYEHLVDLMFLKNPTLAYDSLEFEVSLKKLAESKNARLPDLNLNVYNSFNDGRSLDPVTYQYTQQSFFYNTYRLQSNLTLFEGGKNINTIDKYKIDLGIKQKLIQSSKINLRINLFMQYSEICMLKELQILHKKYIDDLFILENLISSNVNNGKSTNSAKALVGIDVNKYMETLNTITYKKNAGEFKIKTLLGYDNDSILKLKYISAKPIEHFYYSTDELNAIVDNSVSSHIYKEKINYAYNDIQLSRGYRYPTISLSGILGTGYSSALSNNSLFDHTWSNQIDNNRYQIVSLNLYVPIFNKFSNTSAIQKNKIIYQQSISKQTENKLQLTEFLTIQNEKLKNGYDNYLLTMKSLELIDQVIAEALLNFNAGRIGMLEYLTIKKQKLMIEENLIILKFNYWNAQKSIELLKP